MVAIYARQSVDKGEQSLSIESQIIECQRRLRQEEQFEVFQDKGYSGANINRPNFTLMMKKVKSGHIHKVIVWKLDRISRSLLDFANIMDVFNQNHVEFDSVIDNFETSTPMGRAMLNIVMVFAQLERETIQLRILANYQKRAEKGFYLGGPATFGLVKKPITVGGYQTSTYELDPLYGRTLLLIFQMYAETDVSLGKLAKYLNENGHTTQNGTLWESQKLSRILHNPTYVKSSPDIYQFYKSNGVHILSPIEDFTRNGLYLFGRRKTNERKYTNVQDHSLTVALHEGVIDSDQWLEVQRKLAQNVQIKNSGKGKTTWLSGLVKCGLCGYALTGQNMGHYAVLRCSRRINFGDCEGITGVYVTDAENAVWSAILLKLDELQDVTLEQKQTQNARVTQIKLELAKIEETIENLVNALAEGNEISARIISERIAKLDGERNALTAEMEGLSSPHSCASPPRRPHG